MIVFYVILQDKIVILNSGIVKNVGVVGFLEQSIADVFFVSKNFVDGVCMPSFSSCTGENAITFQLMDNLIYTTHFVVTCELPVRSDSLKTCMGQMFYLPEKKNLFAFVNNL